MNGKLKELVCLALKVLYVVLMLVLTAIATLLSLFLVDFLVRLCWNFVVPDIIGLPSLQPVQGLALTVLIRILRGGSGVSYGIKSLKKTFVTGLLEIDDMVLNTGCTLPELKVPPASPIIEPFSRTQETVKEIKKIDL